MKRLWWICAWHLQSVQHFSVASLRLIASADYQHLPLSIPPTMNLSWLPQHCVVDENLIQPFEWWKIGIQRNSWRKTLTTMLLTWNKQMQTSTNVNLEVILKFGFSVVFKMASGTQFEFKSWMDLCINHFQFVYWQRKNTFRLFINTGCGYSIVWRM